MNGTKILIVEDEYPIQELLKFNLERNNYLTSTIDSGNKVIEIAENGNLDLILLDIMLPDINGLELCRLLKNNDATKHIPIILITALSDEQTIVDGLEIGADDYITKPFSPNVLLARIKNCLKRYGGLYDKKSILKIHSISIDKDKYQVFIGKKEIKMTHAEFMTLQLFCENPGRVFTRYQIVDHVHGTDHIVTDRSVDVQIVGLRKKLLSAGKYIETVRGIGYRFKENL